MLAFLQLNLLLYPLHRFVIIQTSQRPSHAKITKSSSSESSTIWNSGFATTRLALISNSSNISLPSLKSASPKALETAKTPHTRPWYTFPPASTMRLSSTGSLGLWSFDSAIALPARERTVRESPQLAQYARLPTTRSVVTVEPTLGHSSSLHFARKTSSTLRNVLVSARFTFSSWSSTCNEIYLI